MKLEVIITFLVLIVVWIWILWQMHVAPLVDENYYELTGKDLELMEKQLQGKGGKLKYTVQIDYVMSHEKEIVEIETDDIEWSMNQYQRNRQGLSWKVIEIEE
jgi:hypothetical protein